MTTDAHEADVEIVASVVADSVRFEDQPAVRVTFPGTGDRASGQITERRNIETPVRPGVTYRDVTVTTRISSRLRDAGFEP